MLPDDFFKKNMEMWEKFTSSYMDSMFKTVDKTLEQSKAIREQVDKAVSTAVHTQMDATMSTLETMQRQLEALSVKIDELLEKQKSA